jgi:hypothetical protein
MIGNRLPQRNPSPGDVRVVSDGGSHAVLVWSTDQQWEPLRGVVAAQVLARAGEPLQVALQVELGFLDVMTPRDLLNLELVGAVLPPREGV